MGKSDFGDILFSRGRAKSLNLKRVVENASTFFGVFSGNGAQHPGCLRRCRLAHTFNGIGVQSGTSTMGIVVQRETGNKRLGL